MAFKLVIVIVGCLLSLKTLGENHEGMEKMKLIQKFIEERLASEPEKSYEFTIILTVLHDELIKGSTIRVDYLASLIERQEFEAFDKYASILAQEKTGSRQPHDKLLEDVLDLLSDDIESEEKAAEIMAKEEKNSINLIHAKAIVATLSQVGKTKIGELMQQISGHRALAGLQNGNVATVALIGAQLGYDVIHNMHRWWNNEISGRRCVKNIIDSFGTTAGGVFGAAGGVALCQAIGGTVLGPLAAAVCGIGGAVFGSQTIGAISEELTEKIFDLPKTEAEENAYYYFGLDKRARNDEINKAYRAKSQRFHPDNQKTGDEKEFLKANINLQILKMARKDKKSKG